MRAKNTLAMNCDPKKKDKFLLAFGFTVINQGTAKRNRIKKIMKLWKKNERSI